MKAPHPDNKVEPTGHNADSAAGRPTVRPLSPLSPLSDNNAANDSSDARPKEIGGRDDNSPDPTRYGDWEKAGRCIDF